MPDDLDTLIRAAMKTLDDEVPSGYFEALPSRTLARLEGSMQHGSSGTTETRDKAVAPPPVAASPELERERDEDSGLHDIRNLAQSTKQRLSRRITQNPAISDNDILASSSGRFKNIALPQPARMVSLPEIADAPVEQPAKKAKDKKPEKHEKAAAPVAAIAPVAAPVEEAAPAVPARQAFSLPSQQNKKSKGPLLALVGMGLAAAAGGVIFLQVNKKEDAASQAPVVSERASVEAQAAPAAAPPVATGAAAPAEPTPPPPEEPTAEPEPAVAEIAADDAGDEEGKDEPAKTSKRGKKPGKADKAESKDKKIEVKQEKPPVEKKPAEDKKTEGEGEPSFDALLKEAGVEAKKEVKPKLEKKKLTADDFKKGMSAVNAKAKGCYKGTVGTAMVRLTISPAGQVSKITVSGDFAGKPEAACVEAAVKGATFPPWDGGPMTFTYSYMLSD